MSLGNRRVSIGIPARLLQTAVIVLLSVMATIVVADTLPQWQFDCLASPDDCEFTITGTIAAAMDDK